MTEPTTDRPTDTIRDAFEAMIAFLTILIGGPMPRAWPDIAAVAARAIGSQARTTEEADRAVAALASFRDLIQRAAEEHNRRAAAGGAFTPKRIREARERCDKATPGPWTADDGRLYGPPDESGQSVRLQDDDLDFAAHAREDLPAALAEIERRATHAATWKALARRLMRRYRSERRGHDLTRSDRKKHRAEIERLTARLSHAHDSANKLYQAAREVVSLTDESVDADDLLRAVDRIRAATETAEEADALAETQRRDLLETQVTATAAALAAVGFSADKGEPLASIFERAWLWCVETGQKRAAGLEGKIERLTAELAARAPADASLEVRAKCCDFPSPSVHDGQPYCEACDTDLVPASAVDASRPAAPAAPPMIDPGFAKPVWTATVKDRVEDNEPIQVAVVSDGTTYQPRFYGLGKWRDPAPDFGYRILAAWALASRPGLTEEQARRDFEAAIRDAAAKGGPYCVTHAREAVATLDASRGETGPAPTGLTSAMHAAQQRRSVPPASAFGEWPDEPRGGLTCPGCYDATGIAQPHDPRATLHAGDPASLPDASDLRAIEASYERAKQCPAVTNAKRGGK